MIITKYNAICNLGENINDIFSGIMTLNTNCFELKDFARVGVIKTKLPQIENQDYNIRANQLIIKLLDLVNAETLNKKDTAVVVATTNSGVEEYEKTHNPKHYQIGNSAEFVHKYLNLSNYYASVSTACSSGIKAFSMAKDLLDSKLAKNVIVIGVDTLAKVPLYGFHSLEILSQEPSIPFSKNRNGINIGEGGAIFVLQKEGDGIEVAGIGETTDYYHMTTPNPDGVEAEQAVRDALGSIKPQEVDYINLHGTGTIANDLMEARVIYNVFGDKVPASSTKPFTGHCLGAAACIEAALCCKLLDSGGTKVFPHIYDDEYDDELPKIWLPSADTEVKQIKTCLSNSFGFGGTNCAMVLRKQD